MQPCKINHTCSNVHEVGLMTDSQVLLLPPPLSRVASQDSFTVLHKRMEEWEAKSALKHQPQLTLLSGCSLKKAPSEHCLRILTSHPFACFQRYPGTWQEKLSVGCPVTGQKEEGGSYWRIEGQRHKGWLFSLTSRSSLEYHLFSTTLRSIFIFLKKPPAF